MSKIRFVGMDGRRLLRGSVGFSPIFAVILASQPGIAVAQTLPASSVVSVCSGVSLPASVVTGIIAPVLTGTVTPLQTGVNSLLAGVLGTPTTFNLSQLLSSAASGSPITLDALSTSGTVIAPNSSCYSQASGFTLATPAGIAIGGNQITGLGNNGATANAGELNSIAFGNGASTATTAVGAVALGTNAAVTGSATGGLALGNSASVSAANSVAIGASSVASRGALSGYTGYALSAPQTSAGEVSFGTVGAARQLTNVAAGSNSTDAVNVAQLTAVNGQVTTNTANIATQATQIAANTSAVGTLSNLAVEYNDANHGAITLGGTGAAPVALNNVQAGALTATSTSGVNGSQLFATNANVAANTSGLNALGTTVSNQGSTITSQGAQLSTDANAINALNSLAVEYNDSGHGAITLGGVGSAPVALGNVQAGIVSATSTDAVNGGQLFATNANVAANTSGLSSLGSTVTNQATTISTQGTQLAADTNAIGTLNSLAVEYNDAGHGAITLGGMGSAPVALGNIQAGVLSATSTDAVNGGQLFATNANVAANTSGLSSLGSTVTNQATTISTQGAQLSTNTDAIGTLNSLAVEYNDPGHGAITLGGVGSSPVALGNVQAGAVSATSTDAVNGGQLFSTNANVAINTSDINALSTTVGNQASAITQDNADITANANAIVSLRSDTANGAIGPVQYSSAAMPTTPNGGVPTNSLTLVGVASAPVALHNVANGTVAAGSTDAVNGGQLFALGNQIGSISDLAVEYDGASKSSVTLGGAGSAPVALGNIQAGALSATSTDAVNGGQLFATNTNVAINTSDIAAISTTVGNQASAITQDNADITANANAIVSLRSDTANGAIGPVQYTSATTPTMPNGGVPTNSLTLVGATPAPVALHNVADGAVTANSTDAVNGSQLYTLSNQVGSISTLGVEYDDSSRTSVTLGGTGSTPVALHNVQAGTLSVASTDAVNGSQLFSTNASVASNTADIATLSTTVGNQTIAIAQDGVAISANTNAIGSLRSDTENGAIGPVEYSSTAMPTTPNGGVPTNSLTLVGATAAPVALHNVADGAVAANSTDAINGGQLYTLSNQIGSISTLGVQYDDSSRASVTLGGAGSDPVALHNVQAGTLTANSTDAINGSQLYATNELVAGLTTDVSSGGIGPVQYSTTAQPTTSDSGVPSQDLTLVGASAGPVALHNVAAGSLTATSTDAVNGAQLYATNQSVLTLTGDVSDQASAITSLGSAISTNATNITQTTTALDQLSTSVANGGIGPVQYSSTSSPTTPDGGVPSQDLTLVGATNGPVALHNLAAGSLAAGSTDAVNGSQLGALGTATASVFGTTYTYNPTTNSYSGSFSYDGSSYSSIQAVLGAIQTSVTTGGSGTDDTGVKYFHTTSTLADSSADGMNSTAIGPNAVSSGGAAIAVGSGAVASGDSAVAIGDGATAQNGEAVSIGESNMASGNGAVSIGDPNVATGDGATALGKDNTATGDGAIALGNTNSATGQGAAAIGYLNTSDGDGAATIGNQNSATGAGAIAIGANNVANGDHSLAIGTNVQTTATDTLAIGSNATSSGTSSVTVGNRALANSSDAVAVANDSRATGIQSSAFGDQAAATNELALAEGAMSSASGFASTAVGAGATVSGFASTAIGTGSIASQDGSVALGSASETVRGAVASYSAFGLTDTQSSAGEIAIARNVVYTDPTTGLPTLTGNRQITGVAAGMADTDAVNVSQLRGASAAIGNVVATALGGGSSYNATTGQLTAPSYTLGTVTYGSVGDALQALAQNETSGGSSGTSGSGGTSVTYSDPSRTTIQLASTGTTIQNVAPGAVTSASTDAVNGSQLASTNAAVASNSQAISNLSTQVSNGAVGVVRYSSSSAPTTANGGTVTNDVTLVGADASAPVALHNVAAGTVAAGSTDAVNGSQLAATNNSVAAAQTTANSALALGSNSIQYDSSSESSVTLGNASSGEVTIHNVAPGITATDAANVGQVNAAMTNAVSQANDYTDGKIAALSFDLRNVQRDAAAGAAGAMAMAGMPQPYEAGKGMIAMGTGTFQGQTAIALGAAAALKDGHTVLKIGATYNSRGMVGANAGVGWQF